MQAYLICQHGVYLTERRDWDYLTALYALNDFYAEVHYRFADSEVLMISSFYNTHLLMPYLNNVNISELLLAVSYP